MSIDHNKNSYPTVGQLERDIAQKVNTLYHNQLGHRASKINCHLLDNKIIIFCEDVITPIEQILLEASSFHLIYQVRTFLDSLIKVKIEELIEKIVRVKVNNSIYKTTIETASAVGIVMLVDSPQVRAKKANRQSNRQNIVQFKQPHNELESC
ncbi:MAG: DUF2294 domain-containing protein [Waterburya sp.]